MSPVWIPGPWAPVGEVDWEAYKRRINGLPDSPHQAAMTTLPPETKKRRTAKESETNG
jgi:hypothetical protein